MNEDDHSFIRKIKRDLNEGTQRLDAATQSRLTRLRHEALDAGERQGFFAGFNFWHSAYRWPGLATAGTATLVVFLYFQIPAVQPNIEDLDLLASEDQLELYQDLEFYAWLADQRVAGPLAGEADG